MEKMREAESGKGKAYEGGQGKGRDGLRTAVQILGAVWYIQSSLKLLIKLRYYEQNSKITEWLR